MLSALVLAMYLNFKDIVTRGTTPRIYPRGTRGPYGMGLAPRRHVRTRTRHVKGRLVLSSTGLTRFASLCGRCLATLGRYHPTTGRGGMGPYRHASTRVRRSVRRHFRIHRGILSARGGCCTSFGGVLGTHRLRGMFDVRHPNEFRGNRFPVERTKAIRPKRVPTPYYPGTYPTRPLTPRSGWLAVVVAGDRTQDPRNIKER